MAPGTGVASAWPRHSSCEADLPGPIRPGAHPFVRVAIHLVLVNDCDCSHKAAGLSEDNADRLRGQAGRAAAGAPPPQLGQ